MRDVTDNKNGARNIANYILQFVKNPVREISQLPEWSWRTAIWVQIILSMISGVLAGLIKPNFFGVLFGIIMLPVISTVMVSLLTAFLYYYFQVFEQRTTPALRLFVLSVLSSIPFFIFQIASPWIPPITLVGFAFSSMLLAVGLGDNFQVEKKKAIRLAIVLFSIVLIVWIGNQINSYRMERSAVQQARPDYGN